MKKILTLLVCTVLIFSSCNKNKKFNKTLDGTWMSTTIDGQPVASGDAYKMTFSKDGKDDGKVTLESYEDGQQQFVLTGTYKITEKGKTLTIDASTSGVTYNSVGTISNSSDSKFTATERVTVNFAGFPGTDTRIVEYTKQ